MPDLPQGLDAVDAVHRDVEQADVWTQLRPERHSPFAITGLANDAETGLRVEQIGQARPHHRMVVDEQETDSDWHGECVSV